MQVRFIVAQLSLVACGTTLGGCAINDGGIGTFRYYESATARAIEMKTFGVHLTTDAIDGGLTIGYSEKTLYFPKQVASKASGDNAARARDAAFDPALLLTDDGSFTEVEPFDRASLGEAIAVSSKRVGLAFAANAQQVGVTLGARQRTALAVDGESDTVTMVYLSTAGPLSSRMVAWGFER